VHQKNKLGFKILEVKIVQIDHYQNLEKILVKIKKFI